MIDCDDSVKIKLRRVRGVAGKLQDIARNKIVTGCLDQGYYIQFGVDLRTYNLWEALLYASNSGGFTEEAVQAALDAVIEALGP